MIEKGDLVQVVRDCCGAHLGITFVFDGVVHPNAKWICMRCPAMGDDDAVEHRHPSLGWCFPVYWLKKIPPLSDDDVVKEWLKEVIEA